MVIRKQMDRQSDTTEWSLAFKYQILVMDSLELWITASSNPSWMITNYNVKLVIKFTPNV